MGDGYVELHCHSNFSFLDGASSADELAEETARLGQRALAVTDHQGLYGVVRFASAVREAGLRPIIGLEVELHDAAVEDPVGLVVPCRRGRRRRPSTPAPSEASEQPRRPAIERLRPPGHRQPRREELRGVRARELGPHLVLLARDMIGYRSLCRLVSAAQMAGTKGVPRFDHRLLAQHAEGLVALSGCRHGEVNRRLLAGDGEGARAAARRLAGLYGEGRFYIELQHHLLPEDDWLVGEGVELAGELGLPVVVTNDVHYARPEGRELHDVLVGIRHGLTLDASAHLRRPNGEYHLKDAVAMAALPPGAGALGPRVAQAWAEGMRASVEIAEHCDVSLEFEQYRFPGFPVPAGETPFSELERLCHEGARRRYHPLTPSVVKQLAHELEVIDRTGLAEFFLICWDLMRFCRERGIPAQGRGSAGDSIVAYVLGITRVDPIRHRLLFERFINEGRTTYPDVDIDFATSRREEVIQYCYERYGPEHTGMVCNVVTYRARSAVREVGYALGFPRPLVDRVAKALETYDSVMVRRDLEAEGGFAEFFAPAEAPAEAASQLAEQRGVLDGMGRLRAPSDDEGGPGDTPVSVRWLKGGVPRIVPVGPAREAEAANDYRPPGLRDRLSPPFLPAGQGDRYPSSPAGVTGDARLGVSLSGGPTGLADPGAGRYPTSSAKNKNGGGSDAPWATDGVAASSASFTPLSPWDRWLDLTARIAELPRHLSIHSGGMLITQAPLVDIAPLERATMPGRVVVQYDKHDIETLKLIKLDLLGLRMLSAIDDALRDIHADCAVQLDLDRLPEDIPDVFRMICAADTVGVFQIESRAQMQTLPRRSSGRRRECPPAADRGQAGRH
ncbi:MAG TPA: PHP domain-containing protein, partial [Candidatus Limnocylindrales bacterium]|nr:PHP domain-containing protein [Candidatus Limnocylindrales bacterium]